MLKGIDATSYFPKIVLGEECVRPKPFPEPYLEGLKLIGREAHECLAFEDSPSGGRQQHPSDLSPAMLHTRWKAYTRAEAALLMLLI